MSDRIASIFRAWRAAIIPSKSFSTQTHFAFQLCANCIAKIDIKAHQTSIRRFGFKRRITRVDSKSDDFPIFGCNPGGRHRQKKENITPIARRRPRRKKRDCQGDGFVSRKEPTAATVPYGRESTTRHSALRPGYQDGCYCWPIPWRSSAPSAPLDRGHYRRTAATGDRPPRRYGRDDFPIRRSRHTLGQLIMGLRDCRPGRLDGPEVVFSFDRRTRGPVCCLPIKAGRLAPIMTIIENTPSSLLPFRDSF
jgi:hypothetical protein